MVIKKLSLAILGLCLIISATCNIYKEYASFARADSLPSNKCPFNSLGEAVESISTGITLPNYISCLELYSPTYYLPLDPATGRVRINSGVRIGYGLDLSVTGDFAESLAPFGLKGLKGDEAYRQLSLSEEKDKVFTETLISKLYESHFKYFMKLVTEKVGDANKSALENANTLLDALFIYYYNNYDLIKSESDPVAKLITDAVTKNSYETLIQEVQKSETFTVARRAVIVALLDSLVSSPTYRVRLGVVVSASPTVLTAQFKTLIGNLLTSSLQRIDSNKVANVTNVEVSVVTVSQKSFKLAVNGTGVNRVGSNLTLLTEAVNSLSPFEIGEGEKADFTNFTDIYRLALGVTPSSVSDGVENVVLVLSNFDEFTLKQQPLDGTRVFNFVLKSVGKSQADVNYQPNTYLFTDLTQLNDEIKNVRLENLWRRSVLRVKTESFVKAYLGVNPLSFAFTKTNNNNAVVYLRSLARPDNTTVPLNASISFCSRLPNPARDRYQMPLETELGSRRAVYGLDKIDPVARKVDSSVFNLYDSNSTTQTVYVNIQNLPVNGTLNNQEILIKFSECDGTLATCNATEAATKLESVYIPYVNNTNVDVVSYTNFTAASLVILGFALLFVIAALVIFFQTPKDDLSSMRALSEMSAR